MGYFFLLCVGSLWRFVVNNYLLVTTLFTSLPTLGKAIPIAFGLDDNGDVNSIETVRRPRPVPHKVKPDIHDVDLRGTGFDLTL